MADEIDRNTLVRKIGEIVSNLANLQVSTLVGNFEIETDDIKRISVTSVGSADAPITGVVSNLNLLEGDIATVMSVQYAENPEDPVRKFHDTQMQSARDTVNKNVRLISDMIEKFFPE